jgi:hypothetical protein
MCRRNARWLLALVPVMTLARAHPRPLTEGLASCARLLPATVPAKAGTWAYARLWSLLQKRGYVLSRVRIRRVNVFNLARPGEDLWYTRLVNFLHIKTRASTVRTLLFLRPGRPVRARTIYENERFLRSLGFFRNAVVVPVDCRGRRVTARVITDDAWTLKLDFKFGRVGGVNETRYKLVDTNFLGFGKTIGVGHATTLERTETIYEYKDPALLGTHWQGAFFYDQLSDGARRILDVTRPFLRDTSPVSWRFSDFDQQEDLEIYDHAALAETVPWDEKRVVATYGRLFSARGSTFDRVFLIARLEDDTYGVPNEVDQAALVTAVARPQRREHGLGLGWQSYQDRYASFENIRYIDRVEDYDLGWNVSARLLFDPTLFGSSATGWAGRIEASDGWRVGAHGLLLGRLALEAQRYDGRIENGLLRSDLTLYDQSYPFQTLVFHGAFADELHPFPENLLYLGGANGLRGYPNFFRVGTARWIATVEDRLVTSIVLLHTFVIGFVAYADAGAIRRLAPGGWSRVYADAGGGLRLGNLRGAYGQVLYFTLAWPLVRTPNVPSHQFVVGDQVRF